MHQESRFYLNDGIVVACTDTALTDVNSIPYNEPQLLLTENIVMKPLPWLISGPKIENPNPLLDLAYSPLFLDCTVLDIRYT